MTGDGLITFDSGQGLPREVRFQGQMVENDENVTVRVPFELTCRLLAGREREQAMIVPVLPMLALRPIGGTRRRSGRVEDARGRSAAPRIGSPRPPRSRPAGPRSPGP